jgi:hypothetical protein
MLGYCWAGATDRRGSASARTNWPSHQLNPEFSPQRLYSWFETLFTDYQNCEPRSPEDDEPHVPENGVHEAWAAGIDPRKASIAIGCNVDTMMKHYVQMDKHEVTDVVFAN